MAYSRSEVWQRLRDLEDLQALLARVMDRQRIIRLQAWHEGSWERVFIEATAQGRELARLHERLSNRWGDLVEEARDDE